MSLPASTIEQLRTEREKDIDLTDKIEALEAENRDLRAAIDRQKGNISALEMANATMRRRIESLERDRENGAL